jgi:DNA replication initiation complex subunit (GINS family)
MSTKELKSEIHRTLENVPEDILQDILDYLKELEKHTNKEISFSRNLRKILTEDKNLLEQLAK